jgi:uncharacterized protein (DUF1778 family)
MDPTRINVGIRSEDHKKASAVCGLVEETIQDFVSNAANERAEKVIADFRSGKALSKKCRDGHGGGSTGKATRTQ